MRPTESRSGGLIRLPKKHAQHGRIRMVFSSGDRRERRFGPVPRLTRGGAPFTSPPETITAIRRRATATLLWHLISIPERYCGRDRYSRQMLGIAHAASRIESI